MKIKIRILKELGAVGVITECKPFISSTDIEVLITGASGGTLIVGARSYAVKSSGEVVFPEWEMLIGENKIIYTDGKQNYDCGKLTRNGRFLSVHNLVDKLVIDLAVASSAQAEEIVKLKEELKTVKQQYGISIIGG